MKILKPTIFTFSVDDEDKPRKEKKMKKKEKKINLEEDPLPKLSDNDVVYDYMIVNFNKKNKNEKKNMFQYNEKNCLLTSSVFNNDLKKNNLKNSVLMNKKLFNENKVNNLREKYLKNLSYFEKPPKKLKKILEDFKIQKEEEKILNLKKKEERYNKLKNNSVAENYQSKKKNKDSEISHALEYFKTIQQLLKMKKNIDDEKEEEESLFTKKKSVKNTITDFNINEFNNDNKDHIIFEENEVSADECFINPKLNQELDNKINDLNEFEIDNEFENENNFKEYNIEEIESIKTDSDIEELECSFEIVEADDFKIKAKFNDYNNLNKFKKKKMVQFYKEEEIAAFNVPKKNNFLKNHDIKQNIKNDLDFIFSDISIIDNSFEDLKVKKTKYKKISKNNNRKMIKKIEKSENIDLKDKIYIKVNSLTKELEEIKNINNFFRNFK